MTDAGRSHGWVRATGPDDRLYHRLHFCLRPHGTPPVSLLSSLSPTLAASLPCCPQLDGGVLFWESFVAIGRFLRELSRKNDGGPFGPSYKCEVKVIASCCFLFQTARKDAVCCFFSNRKKGCGVNRGLFCFSLTVNKECCDNGITSSLVIAQMSGCQ